MITLMNILLGLGVGLFLLVLMKMYSDIPDITNLLLSANIGIYIMTAPRLFEADVGILYRYGSSGIYLLAGRYETLITSMFLHANILHIGLNMYALYILGKVVELSVGKWKYLLMYFASGIVGNILSAFLDMRAVGVGASGAIMGLLGYMVAMEYRMTGKLSASTVFIALFVIFGGFSANVDIWAHAGGFIVGLIWGLMRRFRPKPRYEVSYDLYY